MSINDYLPVFAAEIKMNMKNTITFFNAMQTSCIKNRCMMDVLKVIFSTNTSKKSIFNTAYYSGHGILATIDI
jgi:hypothetical protein